MMCWGFSTRVFTIRSDRSNCHAIEPASDADMLRHLMSAKAVNQAEIHQATGIPKSTISEVLSGKKPFSRQMIRKLAAYFEVDVTVLAGNL